MKQAAAEVSLDGRIFRGAGEKAEAGEASTPTVFEYHEDDGVIWARYEGGVVVSVSWLERATVTGLTSATANRTLKVRPPTAGVQRRSRSFPMGGSGLTRTGRGNRSRARVSAPSKSPSSVSARVQLMHKLPWLRSLRPLGFVRPLVAG
jgi:hypothetical protein